LAVAPDSDEREVAEATVIMGRPVQGHLPHQRRDLPDSAAFQSEDVGGSPRQTVAIRGGFSGQAALRREQCYLCPTV
jgi:hypothetical protein